MHRFISLHAPVLRGLRSPARATIASLAVVVALATAVAYLLPLSQGANDTASNLSFTLMMVLAVLAVGTAITSTSGAQRWAWGVILVAFSTVAIAFGVDPQIPDGDLTIALDLAVLPSLAFAAAVVALCVPALPKVASLRSFTDIAWLCVSLIVVFWASMVEPLADILGRSELQRISHLGFVGTTLIITLAVLVVLPNMRGPGLPVLWCLGLGGALVSAAGVLHIRFFYEGTLRFGSAFDYLWTVGIAFLILGALLAGDHGLEFTQRGMWWNVAITVIPIVPVTIALARLPHDTDQPLGAALIVVLGFRVIALLLENERLNRTLAAEAANDPLTGLSNRRSLSQGIGEVGATAVRRGRYRAVLAIDLDGFKAVNDRHGHLVGDRVLALVGERLRHGVRGDAALIRFGGDEFVVAIDIVSSENAERTGERIRKAIAGDYVIDELVVAIDATIGIALDDGRRPVADMLERADRALYEAKAAGRGRVLVAGIDADATGGSVPVG